MKKKELTIRRTLKLHDRGECTQEMTNERTNGSNNKSVIHSANRARTLNLNLINEIAGIEGNQGGRKKGRVIGFRSSIDKGGGEGANKTELSPIKDY